MLLMLIDGFRLESTTKSPVMTHYNESCKGIPLIRSMGMYREFMQRMYDTNKENCRYRASPDWGGGVWPCSLL